MIFDEVVTGFRVALSGAQGYFGVVPDLTVFGKIVAGGYPSAGGVGSRKNTRSSWRSLATGQAPGRMSATLAVILCPASPGYTAIREIRRTNACGIAWEKWATACMTASKGLLDQYGLPFVAYNQAPSCISSAPAR